MNEVPLHRLSSASSHACGGTGLIALDRLEPDLGSGFSSWAGGSCANVLAILAYLGWETYPIARLGDDVPARAIVSDLGALHVRTDYVSYDRSVNTPVIIERLTTLPDGTPSHRFEFCNGKRFSWYPEYRPVLARMVPDITCTLPHLDFFYFDRLSRAALDLALHTKKKGGLVFFEPSSVGDKRAFIRALGVSDIVKYSSSRLVPELPGDIQIPLEIQTLGSDGLRFRLAGNGWHYMGACCVGPVKDTVGAGDWCSAGLIHALGGSGTVSLDGSSGAQIADALDFAQLLAGAKCVFSGSRGCMYGAMKGLFESLVFRGAGEGQTP